MPDSIYWTLERRERISILSAWRKSLAHTWFLFLSLLFFWLQEVYLGLIVHLVDFLDNFALGYKCWFFFKRIFVRSERSCFGGA